MVKKKAAARTAKPDAGEPERVRLQWLADKAGRMRQNVSQSLKRHGIHKGADGLYDRKAALHALAVGASLDKNRAQRKADKLLEKGEENLTLVEKQKLAQLRKVVLQCEILELERDKIKGDLMPVAEHRRVLKHANTIYMTLLDAMCERIGVKRKDAALMKELQQTIDEVNAQCAELIG